MFSDLEEAYKGRKVFLTGHTGFKGAWLLKTLSKLGAIVKGYSLEPKNSDDLYHLINGDQLCTSLIADLRDNSRLSAEIVEFQPDFIFHLAAQALVRRSYNIPSETFEVNAIGTANLLDGLRLLKKPCHAVLITTDKVYKNNEWIYPYRETDRLGGHDPYSASKACTELVIDSYRNSFFSTACYDHHSKAIAVARAGNVIGGGDWSSDRLIPDIVRSLNENKKIIVRNPESIRPWQHVLEPVVGYLYLGSQLAKDPVGKSQAYNFGPRHEDALSVIDMLKLCIKEWGSGDFKIERNSNEPHEAGLLKLDISKVASELKWTPKMNASQAVDLTIQWYKQYFKNSKSINQFTDDQINGFFNLKV